MSTAETTDLVAAFNQPWYERLRALATAVHRVLSSRAAATSAPTQSPEEATRIAKTYARAVERIYELGALKSGWNGYRAGPITEKSQRRAIDFLLPLHGLVPTVPAPDIFATNDGAVQLRWQMETKQGQLDLDILIHETHGEYMLDLVDDDNFLIQGRVDDPPSFVEDLRKHLVQFA